MTRVTWCVRRLVNGRAAYVSVSAAIADGKPPTAGDRLVQVSETLDKESGRWNITRVDSGPWPRNWRANPADADENTEALAKRVAYNNQRPARVPQNTQNTRKPAERAA